MHISNKGIDLTAGLLDEGATLLHCSQGDGDKQQLSLSSTVDLLPPTECEDAAAANHISETSWFNAVQQLYSSSRGMPLNSKQEVSNVW
jgi:hypothetical protein